MEITRQRTSYQRIKKNRYDSLILKSKRNIILQVIEWGVNFILWGYMLLVLIVFISAVFGYNNIYLGVLRASLKIENKEIRKFELQTLIYFCIIFSSMWGWKLYNKKRFGKLNRRQDCGITTEAEMLNLGLMYIEDIRKVQTEQVVVFENNPVKEL